METKNMKRNSIAAIAALLLIGAATSANAVLLAPGTSAPAGTVPGASATTEFAGTLLATSVVNINGIFDLNPGSTITELVVRRTVGSTLDFYFQIDSILPNANLGLIHQFNANFYAGFTTDVFWDNSPVVAGLITQAGNPLNGRSAGTVIPDSFARSGSGNTVQVFFPATAVNGGSGSIAAGQKSKWLVIRTNATSYGAGATAIINGLSQNFAMLGPVPEPGSILFGLGLLGVMGTRVIRRRKSGIA